MTDATGSPDVHPSTETAEIRWPDRQRSSVRRGALDLQLQWASILLYVDVFEDEPGRSLLALMETIAATDDGGPRSLLAYGRWFRSLLALGHTPQTWLGDRILRSDNALSRLALHQPIDALPDPLRQAALHDLRILQGLYELCTGPTLRDWTLATLPQPLSLVAIPPGPTDGTAADPWRSRFATATHWGDLLPDLLDHYRTVGTGPAVDCWAFRWRRDRLEPIHRPDAIRLTDLAGYDRQKADLVTNTERLLAGGCALNVLLYGARGTGKSSLVKALLTEFGDRGLRLVEVLKADLRTLPDLVERVRDWPQKVVIFVDDLSFEEDDDDFKALKVALEGSLTARPPHMAIYATTNRRHLVREFFDDRPRPQDADEIHSWDTVNEKLSFGDRFGLTLTFEPADQDRYLAIVTHLVQQRGLAIAPEALRFQALQWATRHNGRSGRTARQFVETLAPLPPTGH